MRATGRAYKLTINNYVDDRRDPIKSTKAAINFLTDLYSEFNSWQLAVAAYNAGGGSDIWFDGDHLKNRRRDQATITAGSGRNSWVPWGVTIDNDRRKHFEDGKVLLAANGFLRWGHKIDYIKCYRTVWFEVMKLPELPPAKGE